MKFKHLLAIAFAIGMSGHQALGSEISENMVLQIEVGSLDRPNERYAELRNAMRSVDAVLHREGCVGDCWIDEYDRISQANIAKAIKEARLGEAGYDTAVKKILASECCLPV